MPALINQNGGIMNDAGAVRCVAFFKAGNQIATNTTFYRYSKSLGTTMNYGEFAAALSDSVSFEYRTLMSNFASYLGMKVSEQEVPLTKLSGEATDAAPGLSIQGLMPRQSCGLITLLTAVAGVKGRGRLYVPFPAQDMADGDGSPTAAYLLNLTALRAAYIGVLNIVGLTATYACNQVLFNRAGPFFNPITSGRSNDKYATQKRRGDYGQPNNSPF